MITVHFPNELIFRVLFFTKNALSQSVNTTADFNHIITSVVSIFLISLPKTGSLLQGMS